MPEGAYLAVVAGMAVVTYLPRLLPLLGLSRARLPAAAERALGALAPALLAALLAAELLGRGAPDPRSLLAVGAALAAGFATRSPAAAVAAALLLGALLHR